MNNHQSGKPITIQCPNCGTLTEWSEKNPDRPFCSERCRNNDFVAWADEDRKMAGNSIYDDFLSGDLENDDN